jgi:hypothetical protein
MSSATTDALSSPLFDRQWYLANNPDVAAVGADPWEHYLNYGAAEGRNPSPLFDGEWYFSQYPFVRAASANPLLHYLNVGVAQGCNPNPLFDNDWYLRRYPDVRATGLNPLQHYLQFGSVEGRDPCEGFDSAWYLRANPDLRPSRLTPLGDYLMFGHLEGRSHAPPPDAAQRDSKFERDNDTPKRIAVYTAIIGDYDCLKIPTIVDANCDYFCFTERDISWQDIWVRRDISWHHPDPVRMTRYVKHNPHVYFAHYEWSIWLDANLQLACAPQALMPEADGTWDIATWKHPFRNCSYAEADQCVLEKKDCPATIRAQMCRYRALGFPENAGLYENNILVRRHNTASMIGLARAWWNEIVLGSRRDQLSFAFVARQRNLRVAHLGKLGANSRNDSRVHFFSHIQRRQEYF